MNDRHDMRGMVFNATVKSLDGFKRYPLLDMAGWVADALCDDLSEIDGLLLPDGSEFRRVGEPSTPPGNHFT